MDDIYRQQIMDHYQHPRHRGELENPTWREHDSNPLCGDSIYLDLDIDDDGTVQECCFHGEGCSISQAAADMLCHVSRGKSVRELAAFDKDDMLKMLGIPLGPVRLKCGLLAYKILKVALVKHASGSAGGGSHDGLKPPSQ